MIKYKSERELEIMRTSGQIVAGALRLISDLVRPGISTQEMDQQAASYIRGHKAEPAFKGYRGYPANICISINEEVVHGIPSSRKLIAGDIVSIDVGVKYKNYCGDAAITLPVGKVSSQAQRLITITKKALELAIAKMTPGARLSMVSQTIQKLVESNGYTVVRNLVGHGIGQDMHEEPQVPNYVTDSSEDLDVVFKPGIVIAIEPMVNEGTWEVETLPNGWTVVTKDRKISAHFEHTVAVVENGFEILTQYEHNVNDN